MAVDADPDAATSAIPGVVPALAMADAAAAAEPVVLVADDEPDPPTRVRHRSGALIALAAVAFAAMISGAAFLLLGNTASNGDDTPLGPQHPATPTHSQHHTRTKEAGAEVVTRPSSTARSTHPVVLRTAARTASSSAPVSSASRTTATSSSAPAPTTSQPVTSTSAAQTTTTTAATTAAASSSASAAP
jgi:hypothetical protein